MIHWDACIRFGVTLEVKHELEEIADNNDVTLEQLMRDLVDDFILNTPQ